MYGMSYDQYWYGDPWMAESFRQYHLMKRKLDNENMWIQGAYIYMAVRTAVNNCINGSRDKYEDKPFDIFPKTAEEKEREVFEEKQKLIVYLQELQNQFNRKHKGVEKDGSDT